MEWDDLRYVLAVADGGSLAGAARSLGVNTSTKPKGDSHSCGGVIQNERDIANKLNHAGKVA